MKSILQNQVQLFLINKQPEVLAIKGAWGVGKTFSWNKWLKEAAANSKVALQNYSYVSLFGLNTLEDLKQAIFQNTRTVNKLDTPASLETFKEDPFGFGKIFGRKSSGILKNIPFIQSYASSIDSIAYFSIRKTIICLDDLERRGENLADKDIMGLVNQLKEEKDCKVVLLFNDTKSSFEGYKEFREKVIDKELQFKITSQEACELAFQDLSYYQQEIKKYAQWLDITNVRILHKIKHHALQLEEKLKDCEPSMIKDTLHSLVLFVWCFYSQDENTPDLDYVSSNFRNLLSRQVRKVLPELKEHEENDFNNKQREHKRLEEQWSMLLSNYKFSLPTQLDLLLADGVKAGYFENLDWSKAVELENTKHKHQEFSNELEAIWDLYRASFADNQDEFASRLYAHIKNNIEKTDAHILNNAVGFFRDFNEDVKADSFIDSYLNYFDKPEDEERFARNNFNKFYDIKDKVLLEKFDRHYKTLISHEEPLKVLQQAIRTLNWSEKDLTLLAALSVDDYLNNLESLEGKDFYEFIKKYLDIGKSSFEDERYNKISVTIKSLLLRLAESNSFNRYKVENIYKVKLS